MLYNLLGLINHQFPPGSWFVQGGIIRVPVTTAWTTVTLPISFTKSDTVLVASLGVTNGIVNIYSTGYSSFAYKALGQWSGNEPLHYIVIGV